MHSDSGPGPAQQKQSYKLSATYASLHLGILLCFIKVKLLAAHTGLINGLDVLTLGFKQDSQFIIEQVPTLKTV